MRVNSCTDASIVSKETAAALSSWVNLMLAVSQFLYLKLTGWISLVLHFSFTASVLPQPEIKLQFISLFMIA